MDEFEALLRRARLGDRRANNTLGRWLNRELRAFFRIRFDDELSRELAQRTALDVLEKLATESISGAELMGRIPAFGSIEIRRWRARQKAATQRAVWRVEHAEVMQTPRGVEEWFAGHEQWQRISGLIDELPPAQRDVLLARLDGYSYATIAAVFNIKSENARVRVHNAKRQVMARWQARPRVTRTTFRTTKTGS